MLETQQKYMCIFANTVCNQTVVDAIQTFLHSPSSD